MVMVLEQQDMWEGAGAGFGAGLGGGLQEQYKQFQEQKKQRSEAAEIDRMWEESGGMQGDPMEQLRMIAKAPVSDQTKGMFIQGVQQMHQQKAQQQAAMQEQERFRNIFGQPEFAPQQAVVEEESIVPTRKKPPEQVADEVIKSTTSIKKIPIKMPSGYDQEMAKAPESRKEINFDEMDDSQLAYAASHFPKATKTLLDKKKASNEKFADRMKFHKEFITDTNNKAEGSQTALKLIGEMDRLEATGNLNKPIVFKTLDKLGLNFLLTPESQAHQNLIVQFTKDIKNYYGARISAFELEVFMKSIPSLSNTSEGRSAIKQVMRTLEKGKILKQELMGGAIEEAERTGKPLSYNFQAQIDKSLRSQLGANAELINRQIKKGLDAAGIDMKTATPAKSSPIVRMTMGGKMYDIPEAEIDEFIAAGGSKA